MTDLPVIMSAPMILATLREIATPGTGKTMTRRLAWTEEPCPQSACPFTPRRNHAYPARTCGSCPRYHGSGAGKPSPWQKVKVGDRLWVKESFFLADHYLKVAKKFTGGSYKADESSPLSLRLTGWRSSRFMPRFASRLTLIVTATKIERLNDITGHEAEREGVVFDRSFWQDGAWVVPGVFLPSGAAIANGNPRDAFACLWDTLHGGGAWLSNPEVVAITFRSVFANIDTLPIAEAA